MKKVVPGDNLLGFDFEALATFDSSPRADHPVDNLAAEDFFTSNDFGFFDETPLTNDFVGGSQESGGLTLEEEINLLKQQMEAKKVEMLNPTQNNLYNLTSKNPTNYDNKDVQVVIDDYDDVDHGETYDDYVPAKLNFGQRHPDPVIESSSLSVVPPPDIYYELKMPKEVVDRPLLSALQLEAVVYACQQHENFLADGSRAGYLIGDGPGVGKGRIIAGIIFENMLSRRTKAVWISVSNDLRYDAVRDLEDISCDVIVYPLNKIPYSDRIDEYFDEYNDVGVLFSTYSSLIGECQSSTALYRNRMDQLLDWLGLDYEGLIIFDECHKAKNLMPTASSKPTKTAQSVLRLQTILPKARIVYCSATGASEPRNMAYMVRLGLWGVGTPFSEFSSFLNSVEKRGVGAMELVAMDMKYRGMYLARQLSFNGVAFSVKELLLSPSSKQTYNRSVKFWEKAYIYFNKAADLYSYSSREKSMMLAQFFASHQRFFKCLCIASKADAVIEIAKQALANNKCVVIGLQSTGESKTVQLVKDAYMDKIVSTAYGILYSLIDRHFPSGIKPNCNSQVSKLCESPVEDLPSDEDESEYANSQVELGFNKQLSLGAHSQSYDNLQAVKRKKQDSLLDSKKLKHSSVSFEENPALVAAGLTLNKYDWLSEAANYEPTHVSNPSSQANIESCKVMLSELKRDLSALSNELPPNTLDYLIDKLGGPDRVAEMTGRKARIVKYNDRYVYQARSTEECPLELININEKDYFMNGQKLVAIISEAASAGISLQSDRRAVNQRKRLHITLELSWSADRAIQQFGRTHRSNQVSPPEYLFIISELAGEKRFASVVAKRLESLGALTHGDRRASESRDLSQFNIDTKYGRNALDFIMKTINGTSSPLVDFPPYSGDFLSDARSAVSKMLNFDNERSFDSSKDKETVKLNKFLNRILGLEVELQNAIYQYYISTLDHFVSEAKRNGKFDYGIIDWGIGDEKVELISRENFNYSTPNTGVITAELLSLSVQRGMSFDEAEKRLRDSMDSSEGFYLSKDTRTKNKQIILIIHDSSSSKKNLSNDFYRIGRPNTGFSAKRESLSKIEENYYQISPLMAIKEWNHQYLLSQNICTHVYLWGKCKTADRNIDCDVGKRCRTIYLFSGAIFTMWDVMEFVFGSSPMRISRITMTDGTRRIGILVPKLFISKLSNKLTQS